VIPVGDFLRTRRSPYVNWSLIAVNLAVFAYMYLTLDTRLDQTTAGIRTSEVDRFYLDWGFVSACLAQVFGAEPDVSPRVLDAICPGGNRELLQVFTAMFVHGGFLHVGGNMLFLWVFGDNVEDSMGHLRYLVFYLLCGVGAAALQTVFTIDEVLPAIGASGAVSGVLGAYLVMHPAQIVQVIILPFFFLPFFVPAAVLIGVYFLTQLFAGLSAMGTSLAGETIAYWAHVGGFVTGFVLIWLFRRRGRPPPRRRLSWLEEA
jgi:membrane associated rhomboid family serine protease